MEKTLIARQDQSTGLNKRDEVMCKCRHKDKHLLSSWVSKHQPNIGPNSLLALAIQPDVTPNPQPDIAPTPLPTDESEEELPPHNSKQDNQLPPKTRWTS